MTIDLHPVEKRPSGTRRPAPGSFEAELLAILPQLRALAIVLTRDRNRADDLLQDSLMLALAGKNCFELGTNLRAWMYRLMRNRLISLVRKRSLGTVSIDEPAALAIGARGNQEDHMACRELEREVALLPATQQEALLLVGIAGYSYEEAAEAINCSVGTVKSRVSRARVALESRLMGDAPASAADTPASAEHATSAIAPG